MASKRMTETPAAEHLRHGLEVEQAFHELRVIAHGIDDLHLHAAQVEAPSTARSMSGASQVR
jgi:hypothetical protein